MKATKTLYRVDDYCKNMGILLYMTADKPYYNAQISEQEADKMGDFLQITEFTCPFELDGMEAWQAGEIVSTTCFDIDQN